MDKSLRVLIVEDSPDDAILLLRELRNNGYEVFQERVDTGAGLRTALAARDWDVVLADFNMPGFDGMDALRIVRESGRDLPFIIVSGTIGEEKAVEIMKAGAHDYIMKGRYARLAPAIERELNEAHVRRERRLAAEEIRHAKEEWERTFDSIIDPILIIDTAYRVVKANSAMENKLGVTTAEAAAQACFRIVHDLDEPPADCPFASFLADGLPHQVEMHEPRLGGHFLVSGSPLRDPAEVLYGCVCNHRDITGLKRTEEALRKSEKRRIQLQAEQVLAARIQAKLLPRYFPAIPGFEIVARCLPAHLVGGDFYDWQEVTPGIIAFTLGDVMGNGMAAAMLMATVRAALRAETQQNDPAKAVQLAERVLRSDLENSESFVTLFHAQLDVAARRLTYVDCGHGLVFLRRAGGAVEELQIRGLPLGVMADETYQEGVLTFDSGDTLVLYSDGLTEAWPDVTHDNRILAGQIDGAGDAMAMMERLAAESARFGPTSDDLTMLLVRCTGDFSTT